MGVIQRQSLKSSIISFIGVAIGVVSTLYIYPDALTVLGLFRSLFDASVLIGIVVMMGSSVSAVRFFPKYQDPSTGHGGLLTWLLLVSAAGFLLFLAAYPLMKDWMVDFVFSDDNMIYQDLVVYVIPLTFLLALINLLSRYISNFRLITIPAALEQLTIKIGLPVLVILYLKGWLSVEGVIMGVVATFAFSALGMIYYLMHLGEWRLARPKIIKDKSGLKEYSGYAWYGVLSGIGSQVAFRIDGLMVSGMLKFESTGIYSISWALTEIIIKPMRAMGNIAAPLLADHLENNRYDQVRDIYRRSSLTMTIAGTGMFMLIWTGLPHIYSLMSNPDLMRQGTYVVFFLGLSQVWDMMTGINNEIIAYSKYYRFNLYLTLLLGLLNVGMNLLFIPMYGLTGAALATCVSIFLFNVAKLVFIQWKYGFHPFTGRLLPVIGFGVAGWLLASALPDTRWAVINLFYKSAAFCLIYGLAIWKFGISSDVNQWIAGAIRKGKGFLQGK